jgi:single-strand DNA-binding protein
MYHTIIIVGNLGRDPEMRYTPTGQAVTSFPVASSRTYTNSNGQQVKETIWFRISAWGKLAETCNNYLRKGRPVLVEGRLVANEQGSPRIWNRADGTPGASFEVNATTVRFLGGRKEAEGELGGEELVEGDVGDEIPF